MSTDLVEFLRARLDEDEQVARAALGVNRMAALRRGRPVPEWEYREDGSIWDGEGQGEQPAVRVKFTWVREAAHIVRHGPVRVLDEVDAKRGILNAHARFPQPQNMAAGMIWACGTCGSVDDSPVEWPCNTLRLLARMYMRHPDYRHEWLPST